MKKIAFTSIILLCLITLRAQVPAGFTYQAVVRNSSGEIIADQPVKFQISILEGSKTGTPVYVETHNVTTNEFGLANLVIGNGTFVEGIFSPGGWGLASHFIKVELDVSGGSDYVHLGTTQLMSVPYAFHAQTVEEDAVNDADADATNEIQSLSLDANVLSLNPDGGSVSLPASGGSSPFQSTSGITSNINLTDNFVFGSSSLDDVSGTSDDIRLLFNKAKGAFRAGKAEGSQWDESNMGSYSIALGFNTVASANYSLSLGEESTASGPGSTALGFRSVASGDYSFATGQSTASENYCTALGGFTTASGRGSTALGVYTIAPSAYETAVGKHNTVYTPANSLGWRDTDRLFVIGNGTTDDTRSNALVMLKNGNTGFGVDNPANKLEVNGQVKIIGGNPGLGKVLTSDANGLASWQTPSSGNTGWTVSGSNVYTSVTGNVGIGNTDPSHKLDVKGNSRIQLTKDNGAWLAMCTDGNLLDLKFSGHNLAIQGMVDGEDIVFNPTKVSKVGIRMWLPQYDLDVNGNIRATGSVYYGGNAGSANGTAYPKPDFVFDESYQSLNTEQIEEFIKKENHLPWITSAKREKEENGDVINMTRMAFETLETVENLQLQLIELNKKLKEMNKLIVQQQQEIQKLKKQK